VGVGLAVLGVTSYGFLAIAARVLDAASFARLSIVWTALFTLGPGVFLPLEQEVARRLAVTGDRGVAAVILRRSMLLGSVIAVAVTGLTVAAVAATGDRLLDKDTALLIAMIAANGCLALVHLSRGYFAGTERFRRYAAQLGIDGAARSVGAALLLLYAVHTASAFGWLLVASQLLAVVITVAGTRPQLRLGRQSVAIEPHIATLARGIGWMLAGTLAAQILANAGPVVVKLLAAPTDAAAGHFLTALVIARVPLFLFAALQASLLPGLAKMVDARDLAALRHSMRRLLVLLAAVGLLITVALAAGGPLLTQVLFGSQYRTGQLPLTILSAGCTVYMLAAALAQALLALSRPALVAAGWWLGVVGFAAALFLRTSLPVRVSTALLLGSVVAAGWFARQLARGSTVPARRAPRRSHGR
jgi:O-antigen/teichoic acid export membrane protein